MLGYVLMQKPCWYCFLFKDNIAPRFWRKMTLSLQPFVGVVLFVKGAFENGDSVAYVSIPHSVTSIEARAFRNCRALEKVIVPELLTEIGPQAFDGCIALQHLNLPKSLQKLGEEAFKNCQRLEDLNFPNLVMIPKMTCYNCSSLRSLRISSHMRIERGAFSHCTALTHLTFGHAVYIGDLIDDNSGLSGGS